MATRYSQFTASEKIHLCLKPAMGLRLLCGVAFCFLGVGLMDAEVTQVQRYLIKRKGEKVLMECLQDMDHERIPSSGLQLLHFSYGVDIYEKGDFPDGYSVSRKKKEGFSLILGSASTNQTSVYLCASSISTALHNHILSAQKGQVPEGSDPNSGLSYTGYLEQRWPLSGTKPMD
ncbi:hypothetical protein QTO34_004639, partial [Cnephaeus nilssonii]